MALARAFTSRKTKRPEISLPAPQRAASTRNFAVNRAQISAPTELLSTTNMLSFNAPDIHHPFSPSSSGSSSGDDSIDSNMAEYRSPTTSVDSTSTGSRACSPEPNHLSTLFSPTARPSAASRESGSSTDEAPRLPQRAVAHTAAKHQALARKRSQQRMATPPTAIHDVPARPAAQPTAALAAPPASASHPFGRELAQVNEIAEDFGVASGVADEEERLLAEKGLFKFGVNDYLAEIHSLCGGGGVFEDMLLPPSASWI